MKYKNKCEETEFTLEEKEIIQVFIWGFLKIFLPVQGYILFTIIIFVVEVI